MLWDRPDLATLRSFATACTPVRGGDGRPVEPERWTLRFPRAESLGEKDGVLAATYTKKSMVVPFGEPLYGELAVLECLRRDGWTGVWVDTFHGALWRDMPERSSSIDLSLEPEAFRVYAGIIAEQGKRGGFFDVFAWRDTQLLFVEYKGKGDRSNANESSWIAAVIRFGISPSQLLIAAYA